MKALLSFDTGHLRSNVRSQRKRIAIANLINVKIGFVERTRNTNSIDGPCPHYLPRIDRYGKDRLTKHVCEQCGFTSPKPIRPYQKYGFTTSEGKDVPMGVLVKSVTDKF